MLHVTIDAENPRGMAQMIAELIQGEAVPFPVMQPASWVATGADAADFSIQVLPRAPGERDGSFEPRHMLVLDCALTTSDVAAIAERHGAAAAPLDPSAMVLRAEDGRRIAIRLAGRGPARRTRFGRLLERLGSR